MKRSLQEYVELVVFGLIALLVGTGLLWVVGWVLSLGGIVLKGLAGLLWMLLRFIVPVAIAGGLVYFLVKAAQGRQRSGGSAERGSASQVPTGANYTPPASSSAASGAHGTSPRSAAGSAAAVDVQATGGVTNGNVDLGDVGPSSAVDPVAVEVVTGVDDSSTVEDRMDVGADYAADTESEALTEETDSEPGGPRNELADDAEDEDREGA